MNLTPSTTKDWHARAAGVRYETRHFIDGQYVDSVARGRFTVVNPATGAPLVRVREASEAQVAAAVQAAAKRYAAAENSIRWLVFYGMTAQESILATYDIVVLDPGFQGSISRIADAGTPVCGYLSLGEIRTSDPFLTFVDPAALLSENPDWPGTRRVDIRVVAATNRPLEDEKKAGRFREDLYYRLNVVSITLPPLKERRGDIPELIEHFLTTRPIGPTRRKLAPEVLDVFMRYDWPGNVRELANVLERAQILAEGDVLTVDDLPETLLTVPGVTAGDADPRHLSEVEKQHVMEVLREVKGNKVQAARILGVSRRALYRLIARHGLDHV
jgi:hypothetical protein